MPRSGGPFVTLAVMCREWLHDDTGTMSIHSMVDTVTWPGSTRRFDGSYAARPHFQFVLELIAGSHRGEARVELGLYDSRNRVVGEPLVFRRWFEEPYDARRIEEHVRLPDVPAGDYRLRATSEGRTVAERLLHVRLPEASDGPVSSPVARPALVVARHCVGPFNAPDEPNSIYGLFEGLGIEVPARIVLGFLVYFVGGQYERDHDVAITTFGPDGKICSDRYTYRAEFRNDVNIGLGNRDHVIYATAHATYWTEVRVDDDLLTRVPLDIYAPGAKAASSDDWQGELTVVGDDGQVTVAGRATSGNG